MEEFCLSLGNYLVLTSQFILNDDIILLQGERNTTL